MLSDEEEEGCAEGSSAVAWGGTAKPTHEGFAAASHWTPAPLFFLKLPAMPGVLSVPSCPHLDQGEGGAPFL